VQSCAFVNSAYSFRVCVYEWLLGHARAKLRLIVGRPCSLVSPCDPPSLFCECGCVLGRAGAKLWLIVGDPKSLVLLCVPLSAFVCVSLRLGMR